MLKGNFGLGLKDVIVGTQLKDQIGAEEVLKTLRQALVEIISLIFWIPFQSQEAEEEIRKEMKSPYLIYLL